MVHFSHRMLIATLCFTISAVVYSQESLLVEQQRMQLCTLLHDGHHCEKSKKLFGPAPDYSVLEYRGYELCNMSNAYECMPTPKTSPSNETDIQKNDNYIKRHTLAITAKNGVMKAWEVIEWSSNEFENDRTESLDFEFDQTHQYFWVRHSFYEGHEAILFSHETGRSYIFQDTAIASPDGGHILVKANEDPFIRLYLYTNKAIEEIARFNIGNLTKNKTFALLWISSNEIAVVDRLQIPISSLARIKKQGDAWILQKPGSEPDASPQN